MSGMWKEWGGDRPEKEERVIKHSPEVLRQAELIREEATRMKYVVEFCRDLALGQIDITYMSKQAVDGVIIITGLKGNGKDIPWEVLSKMALKRAFYENAVLVRDDNVGRILDELNIRMSSKVLRVDSWESDRRTPNKFRIVLEYYDE